MCMCVVRNSTEMITICSLGSNSREGMTGVLEWTTGLAFCGGLILFYILWYKVMLLIHQTTLVCRFPN